MFEGPRKNRGVTHFAVQMTAEWDDLNMPHFAEALGSQPSAVGNIARLAYALARRKGADVDRLLAKAGLSPGQMDNPNSRVRVESQIRFLDLVAEAINDDLLGFHLSLHFDLRTVGLLYYVFASSETLNDALRNGARCSSIANESIRFKVHERKRLTGFVFEHVGIARQSDRHQIEFWAGAIIRACRLITRRHVMPLSVTFAHRRKPTPELNRFFGSKATFGADVDEVTFSPATIDIAVASADTHLNDLLLHYCEEAVAAQGRRGLFSTSVENAAAVLLPHGKARMSEVARKLGQSPRTLARRLASEGLTFAGMLRELRIGLADRYLSDNDLTISQIAWLLGYRDVSAFTNAHKRWTGYPPRAARRRAQSTIHRGRK
jgi:AraC-like DNA-binding protein